MKNIQQEIVQWLHCQQDWMQAAAEQLLEEGVLDDGAVEKLVERLKSPEGQKTTTHRTFQGLTSRSTAAEVRLVSIGNIQGIENLSPRRPLNIGSTTLSVIYGPNGSGKSSYTRLLKRLCGKPNARSLKANVFRERPENRQCDVTYSVDGKQRVKTWAADSNALVDLEPVDIFDAEAATFYLTQESEVAYTPPEVALFEGLAKVCGRIKDRLQRESATLVSKLPGLPQEFTGTPNGLIYQKLSRGEGREGWGQLQEWSREDQARLEQLKNRLETSDPAARAQKKRARKKQLKIIIEALKAASEACGKEGCQDLKSLRETAKDRRRHATEAAKKDVRSGYLDGIGTDTWMALWEAARKYSVQHAYLDRSFPVTQEDARCVLCHQTLDIDASNRLRAFERFVQGELEAAAKEAEDRAKKAMDRLPTAPSEIEIGTQCEAAGLDGGIWLGRLTEFWHTFQDVREKLSFMKPFENDLGIEAPQELIDELEGLVTTLEGQAVQHDADAEAINQGMLGEEKRALEARHWTSQQKGAIDAEMARHRELSNFSKWEKASDTTKVSNKASRIFNEVITQAYVDRFNDELEALGAGRIKVELIKRRVSKCKAKHKIILKGLQDRNSDSTALESVLSDGERRVVALAAFLADVTGRPHAAPFIFDDPISSLDHDFEWEVARRLVNLAKDRQVVVLTHRLSLFGAMEEAARKMEEGWKNKNLGQLCIESFAGSCGHPAEGALLTSNTKKANNILIGRMDEAKVFWEQGDSESYRDCAQVICTNFRKLVERTVEDDLLNQIVRRHRRSVTTDNRIDHLSKITREDCQLVEGLMTKYSCYEHSQSDEAPSFLPEEPELRDDLEKLRDWREELKKRPLKVA